MVTVMKLLRSFPTDSLWRSNGVSRVFIRVLSYSTETLTYPASASKDTLYGRIVPFGNPKVSIVPILDQWIEEGKRVEQEELWLIIRKLRNFRRFKHALEVSEWMTNKRYLDLLPRDMAVRLHLISKVHGIAQAEKFFNNVPVPLRGLKVYGALLSCYAHAECLDKAEAVMQKMRELGFDKSQLHYNVMLKLYALVGKHEKLDSLIQEMQDKGITGDKFTFNTRLHAYVSSCDFERMENLLMKMEADPAVTMDWNTYVLAANGYLIAGAVEKALAMLKKAEQLVSGKRRVFAYQVLLTIYARLGKKDEVYRIWNLNKKIGKIYNMSYLSMISSVVKLDDLDGAEKIWEEWVAVKTYFDPCIPNLLFNAYCKKGLLEKAESIVNRLVENGEEPSSGIWENLAIQYHEDNQTEKAVELMKKAILTSKSRWKPNLAIVAACLKHLKGSGRVEIAEEFIESLEKSGHMPGEVCERLVDYVKNGNSESEAFGLMEGDNQVLEE